MKDKLKEAIDLIEEAGGIVMMQSDDDDLISRDAELLDKTAKDEADAEKYKREYESRKADAFEEFDEMLGSPGFCFNGIDDLCYEHGIDLDDIEEWIYSHY